MNGLPKILASEEKATTTTTTTTTTTNADSGRLEKLHHSISIGVRTYAGSSALDHQVTSTTT